MYAGRWRFLPCWKEAVFIASKESGFIMPKKSVFTLEYVMSKYGGSYHAERHSWAQRKLSLLSPLSPLNILLTMNGPLLS